MLDAFRSYVFTEMSQAVPIAGLGVSANTATNSGQNNEVTYSGTAGGFGGSLLNGSVKNSNVTGLNYVTGLNSGRRFCRILRKKRNCKNGEAGCAGK